MPRPPGARRLLARWRRSLQLRVVTTVVVLTGLVLALAGVLTVQATGRGLLEEAREQGLVETDRALARVQVSLSEAEALDRQTTRTRVLAEAEALQARGAPDVYDVVVLPGDPLGAFFTYVGGDPRVTDAVADAVPPRLRERVREEQVLLSTYSTTAVVTPDGLREVPALVVGGALRAEAVGGYELYLVFPLTGEEETHSLVRRTVGWTTVLLVLLVGGVVLVVTRQVTGPVQDTAAAAERLAGGRLDERVEVEGADELARLGSSFNLMAAALQEQIDQLRRLGEVQRQFVADVSHELRTPLTTVRMAVDVLHDAREDFAPDLARATELLETEVDRFERLLVDLLEISRHDAGVARLEPEVVDVVELVRSAVASTRGAAWSRGVEVVLVDAPPEPLTAEVDPRRVGRLVRNLVGNAIRYGEGSAVVVRVAGGGGAVSVTVRDRGQGFEPHELGRLFDRFWRADRARSRGGTGLGLAIARDDALLHGGVLDAAGLPGRGACFRLVLPTTPHGALPDVAPLALDGDLCGTGDGAVDVDPDDGAEDADGGGPAGTAATGAEDPPARRPGEPSPQDVSALARGTAP